MATPETSTPKRLAILASGGPAPGINSVINAATIEAINLGWEVFGVHDGYRGLVDDDLVELTIEDVAWIHFEGGAMLGMSRTNPKKPENLERIVATLQRHDIDMLLTIGGDDTAFGASVIASKMGDALHCVHVPKTIDNDLPLPPGVPTFGYTTARHVGVSMVKNLMRDARTCKRWYIVISMGRQAGHLALGIGKAAGASLTLIPEEFQDRKVTVKELGDIVEGAVIKNLAYGNHWGVAVLAEGLLERFDPDDLQEHFPQIRRDDYGHILLADLRLGELMCAIMDRRMAERGIKMRFNDITLGYELRCAAPVPFDIEYTRDLGYAAVSLLNEGGTEAMVMIANGKRQAVAFSDLRDPETGRTRVRNVDTTAQSYLVARRYMTRLTAKDFDDEDDIARLAMAAGMSPEAFCEYFEYCVANEPETFAWEDGVRDQLLEAANKDK